MTLTMSQQKIELLESGALYEMLAKALAHKHRDHLYISRLVKKIPALESRLKLASLSFEEAKRQISDLGYHVFEADQRLIEFNEKAVCAYFILLGTCRVLLPRNKSAEDPGSEFLDAGTLEPGTLIGDLSILNRVTRTARVTAK
jgi:hypothetical protein